MPPKTNTEAIDELDTKVDDLEKKHVELNARCRSKQQEIDHNTLIVVEERLSTVQDNQLKFTESHEKFSEKLNEATGSLNILADKITEITKESSARGRTAATVIAGVIVSVVSAIIIFILIQAVSSLESTADKNNIIEQQIEHVVNEIKSLHSEKNNNR